jgi:hypothetical protein
MNIYYTAKDIEEMAAKGMQQLELDPGVTLTDFAKETAQQLGVALVEGGGASPSVQATSASNPGTSSSKYNKPTGCLHTSNSNQAVPFQAAVPSGQSATTAGSNTVNRLVDLMGKVIKRGG